MSEPVTILVPNHVAGDTWDSVAAIGPIEFQSDDGEPYAPLVPLARARIHFTREGATTPALKLDTDPADRDAPIVIESAEYWELSIPPVPPAVFAPVPGEYSGHFETTDTAGTVKTLYFLRFLVLPDLTV
jgi:hypothetical protein